MTRFAFVNFNNGDFSNAFVKNGPLCAAEKRLFLDGNIKCQQSYNYRSSLIKLIDSTLLDTPEKRKKNINAYRASLYDNMVAYRPYCSVNYPVPSSSKFNEDIDVLIEEIEKGSWQYVQGEKEIAKEILVHTDAQVYRLN